MKAFLSASLILLVSAQSISAAEEWQPNGVPMTRATGGQEQHVVIPDGEGGAITAWMDFRNGSRDIYAQRVNGLGAVLWTTDGVAACDFPLDQEYPAIAPDGAGGVIITWTDKRNPVLPGGVEDPGDIYAQRISGEGQVLWGEDGLAICSEPGGQGSTCAAADGLGGAFIGWADARSGNPVIYAMHVNGAGQRIGGIAGGSVVGKGWRTQYAPRAISDGIGGAIIVYQEDYNNLLTVAVQRFGGVGGWGDGLTLSTTSDYAWEHQIVTDGAGGAVVAWRDRRNGASNPDIYAQRVTQGGTIPWTANGVALCAATKIQSHPELVADGTGGAIVVWDDDRFSTHRAYAQRVNGAGSVLWTLDGVRLSGVRESQAPTLVEDGAGGAFIAWEDPTNWFTNQGSDIYGQHLDGSGAPVWTLYGIVIAAAGWWERTPVGVTDNLGGAIMVWSDTRESDGYAFDNDIYAQRITGDGQFPTGVGDTPSAQSLVVSAAYPNPFSAETALDITLENEAPVSVDLFDVGGRRVRTMDLGRVAKGRQVTIDGRDGSGALLPSGVYFYRVRAGGEIVTKKMVITR